MSFDYNEELRRQQACQAEEQRRQEAQRAQQQRDLDARMAHARREAERQRAYEQQQEASRRHQQESVDRQRRDNQQREEETRRRNHDDLTRRQAETNRRLLDDTQRQAAARRTQEERDQKRRSAEALQDLQSTRANTNQAREPFQLHRSHFLDCPTGHAHKTGYPRPSDAVHRQTQSRAGQEELDLSPSMFWLVPRALGVVFILAVALAAAMYWRGYLSLATSGLALNGMPALETTTGLAYRKFDVNMEFRDGNIWTKPKEVAPDSHIDGGPIWTANLTCPRGDFNVEGDLRSSRIYVPNGTLTVDGSVSDSFLSARHIKVKGFVADTVESGTSIVNASGTNRGSRVIKVSVHQSVVEFVPWIFRPLKSNPYH